MIYKVIYDCTAGPDSLENENRVRLNGEFPNIQITDATIRLELNNAGTFNFTVPKKHIHYDKVSYNPFVATVEVYEVINGTEYLIFLGRPIQVTMDLWGNKKFSCEGALAYLNDSIQRPFTIKPSQKKTISEFFTTLITNHNNSLGSGNNSYRRKFEIGTVDINETTDDEDDPTDPEDDQLKNIYRDVKYETTMNAVTTYCLNTCGGYLYVDKGDTGSSKGGTPRIRWLKDSSSIWNKSQNQRIEFAVNMSELSDDFDGTEIFTRLIPIGSTKKNGSAVTIKNEKTDDYHTKGNDYIDLDATAIAQYGIVETVETFSDYKSGKKLLKKAEEWLTKEQFIKLFNCRTLDISSHDLSYINGTEYTIPLLIGQEVNVTAKPIGISVAMPINKIEYNLDTGEKTISIGTMQRKRFSEIKKEKSGTNSNQKKTDSDDGNGSDYNLGAIYISDDENHSTIWAEQWTDPDTGNVYEGWDQIQVEIDGGGIAEPITITSNGVYPPGKTSTGAALNYSTITVSVSVESAINSLYNLQCECADPFKSGDSAYIYSTPDSAIETEGLFWNPHNSPLLEYAPYNGNQLNKYYMDGIYFYSIYINVNKNFPHVQIYSINTIPFGTVPTSYVNEINNILDSNSSSSITMNVGRGGVIRWRVYDASNSKYYSYFINTSTTNLISKIDESSIDLNFGDIIYDINYNQTPAVTTYAVLNETDFLDTFRSDNFILHGKDIYFGYIGKNAQVAPKIDYGSNTISYWVFDKSLTNYGGSYYAYGFTLYTGMLAYWIPQVGYTDLRYIAALIKGTYHYTTEASIRLFSGGWVNTYGDNLQYAVEIGGSNSAVIRFLARISLTSTGEPDRTVYNYGNLAIGEIQSYLDNNGNKLYKAVWYTLDDLFESGYRTLNRDDAIYINKNGFVNNTVSTIATLIVNENGNYYIKIINLSTGALIDSYPVNDIQQSIYYFIGSEYYMTSEYITNANYRKVAYLANNKIHDKFPLGFAAGDYKVGDIGTFLICFE